MATQQSTASDEAQIRQLIEQWGQALHAKDLNTLMSYYAPDILTFDILPPLQYQGVEAYRKNFEAWFAAVQGPIEYETCDLRIMTGEEVAFCHHLHRVRSTRTTGETTETWVRVTVGFRKIEGTWRITHEHVSVPCDMETSQALLDLQP
jgi:uncharacterized protein (TIGR02246 family)